jgi:hypothetical protein
MNGPAPRAKHDPAFVRDLISLSPPKTNATAEAGTKEGHCRPLPKEFRRDGFSYRQIASEGDVAIYEQRWSGCPDPSTCYEVICIRQREAFEIGGRLIEAAETYPRSEDWGMSGWTVLSRDAAFDKVREVCR